MTLVLDMTTSITSFFFRHLPFRSRDCLLRIFDNVWHTVIPPDSWNEAIVIPIPKPSNDSTNPASYRIIALKSCICKTMERMINDCLVWFLENTSLLQRGFRKQRGAVDHLVRLLRMITPSSMAASRFKYKTYHCVRENSL